MKSAVSSAGAGVRSSKLGASRGIVPDRRPALRTDCTKVTIIPLISLRKNGRGLADRMIGGPGQSDRVAPGPTKNHSRSHLITVNHTGSQFDEFRLFSRSAPGSGWSKRIFDVFGQGCTKAKRKIGRGALSLFLTICAGGATCHRIGGDESGRVRIESNVQSPSAFVQLRSKVERKVGAKMETGKMPVLRQLFWPSPLKRGMLRGQGTVSS